MNSVVVLLTTPTTILSGKEIVYAGQRVGVSVGVHPNQSEEIKIYEEAVSFGERHLVTTLDEEIHHSKLLSKRPDLGGQQYNELWKTVVEPRAKTYAQTYAERLGIIDE